MIFASFQATAGAFALTSHQGKEEINLPFLCPLITHTIPKAAEQSLENERLPRRSPQRDN
jgi:hypothetical protein